jgi:putative hemolysin
MRKTRIQTLLEEQRPGAISLATLRQTPERFLATVQIGITVVGTAAAAFGGSRLAAQLAGTLKDVGPVAAYASQVALALVVAVVSYLSLVLGELVPKSLALRSGEAYALLVAKPLLALSWLARPLVWMLTASSNLVLRPFSDRTTFTEARLSREELQQIVDEAARTGALDEHTSELASRALEFHGLTAGDVMIPRNKIVALPASASHEEIKRCLLEQRRSRMPVYDGPFDNVVGYLTAKDILPLAWEGGLIVLRDVLRPVHVVTEAMPATELLQLMRRERQRLAIVMDEHGSVAGLVTFEDLVEELVGEVFSEHERTVDAIVREPGGSFLVRGDVPLRDINRELELELQARETIATIGGLCISLTGGVIPQRGARLAANDGVVLEVLGASARTVRRVRVLPPPRPSTRDGATEGGNAPS